jgi:hypothetical protein
MKQGAITLFKTGSPKRQRQPSLLIAEARNKRRHAGKQGSTNFLVLQGCNYEYIESPTFLSPAWSTLSQAVLYPTSPAFIHYATTPRYLIAGGSLCIPRSDPSCHIMQPERNPRQVWDLRVHIVLRRLVNSWLLPWRYRQPMLYRDCLFSTLHLRRVPEQ